MANKRILTVALQTNYDIRRLASAGDKPWECLPYLADSKPIDPKCPPTKAELEAVGLLPAPQDQQKVDEEQKPDPEALFKKMFKLDIDYLKSLDPKDWKNQDHYAVLGLKKMR